MANGKDLFQDNIGMLLLNPNLLTYESFSRSLQCMISKHITVIANVGIIKSCCVYIFIVVHISLDGAQ